MEDACRLEIVRTHCFIEHWFSGQIEQTERSFTQFSAALAARFTIISPPGTMLTKDALTAQIWQAHGTVPKPFSIEIRELNCRFVIESLCLMTYQQHGLETTARLSSALFRKPIDPDSKPQWLHLHETWLPIGSA